MAKYNKEFARVKEDKQLEYAPLPLVIEGENVWTNVSETYIENGYYPLERTEMPTKEDFYYTSYWVCDTENKVCREEWEEHENPKILETANEEDINVAIMKGVNSIDN